MFASPSAKRKEEPLSERQVGRSNQLWLDELRGDCGYDRQRQAYLDLANYLYRVAYNYLLKRQNDVPLLATQLGTELAALAQDSVQETLAKIAANHAALLDQYAGRGRFLGWMALIIRNHIAGFLRRSPYTREVSPPADMTNFVIEETSTLNRLTLAEIGAELQDCLDALPNPRREALLRCILHGERSKVVASELNRSANAVDQLVMHAKRQVRGCLQQKGIGPEVLGLF
ncbi:MAG: RNA polymerase sigma factor [Caldilineaceae bacterium]|nr:RNA polymerase sigma factor [Caldilineaceae bacterium]